MSNKKLNEGTVKVVRWEQSKVWEQTGEGPRDVQVAHELTIGVDGLSWGFNGDCYPGTLISATVNGRGEAVTLVAQSDNYMVKPEGRGEYEGAKPCDFTPNSNGGVHYFRRDKKGSWKELGGFSWMSLGRHYSYNPHV